MSQNLIEIGTCSDGWLKLRVVAATINYFEVDAQPNGFKKTLEILCRAAPIISRLDEDLMEALDGGKSRIRDADIIFVRAFSQQLNFREVDCALPGFDRLDKSYSQSCQ